MKFALIVAHGSRNPESNRHFAELAARVGRDLGETLLGHAFLEFAEPGIAAGLDSLRAQGARQISLLPYFLSPGNHVTRDIPEIVAAYTADHPEVRLCIEPLFGSHTPAIAALLRTLLE